MPPRNPNKVVESVTKHVSNAEAGMANVVAKLSTSDTSWVSPDAHAKLTEMLNNVSKLLDHASNKLQSITPARDATE